MLIAATRSIEYIVHAYRAMPNAMAGIQCIYNVLTFTHSSTGSQTAKVVTSSWTAQEFLTSTSLSIVPVPVFSYSIGCKEAWFCALTCMCMCMYTCTMYMYICIYPCTMYIQYVYIHVHTYMYHINPTPCTILCLANNFTYYVLSITTCVISCSILYRLYTMLPW